MGHEAPFLRCSARVRLTSESVAKLSDFTPAGAKGVFERALLRRHC